LDLLEPQENDLRKFVMPVGKYKDMALEEIQFSALESYSEWIKDKRICSKSPFDKVLKFVDNIRENARGYRTL